MRGRTEPPRPVCRLLMEIRLRCRGKYLEHERDAQASVCRARRAQADGATAKQRGNGAAGQGVYLKNDPAATPLSSTT